MSLVKRKRAMWAGIILLMLTLLSAALMWFPFAHQAENSAPSHRGSGEDRVARKGSRREPAATKAPGRPSVEGESVQIESPPDQLAVVVDDDPTVDPVEDEAADGNLALIKTQVIEDGLPSPGATVTVFHAEEVLTCTTDTSGACSLTGAPPGDVTVEAVRLDRAARTKGVVVPPDVQFILVLQSRMQLQTTVLDGETKMPISGAKVELSGNGLSAACTTGTLGVCSIDHLAIGQYDLIVEARGYANAAGTLSVIPNPEGVIQWEERLFRGVEVSGTVVSVSSIGIPDCLVWYRGLDFKTSSRPHRGRSTRSDIAGRFSFSAVRPGTIEFLGEAEDRSRGTSGRVLVADDPVSGVRVLLKSGASISGRVVSQDGKPVRGALVQAALWQSNTRGFPVGQASSGEDGFYAIQGLAAGTIHLWALHGEAISDIASVTLVPGESRKGIDLALDHEETICGTVQGSVGVVPGATVCARISALDDASAVAAVRQGDIEAVADLDGRFCFRAIPTGEYSLLAAADTEARKQICRIGVGTKCRTGDQNVLIPFTEMGTIVGRAASGPEQLPVADFSVRMSGLSSTPVSNPLGRFEIAALPGQTSLFVSADCCGRGVVESVDVEARQVTDVGTVVLKERATGVIAGRVVDEDGEPVNGATVYCGPAVGLRADGVPFGEPELARTTAEGAFSFDGIVNSENREVLVLAMGDCGRSLPELLDQEVGDKYVELVCRAEHPISGTLRIDGEPAAGRLVFLRQPAGYSAAMRIFTDQDGFFSFERAVSGRWVVEAMLSLGAGNRQRQIVWRGLDADEKTAPLEMDANTGALTLSVLLNAAAYDGQNALLLMAGEHPISDLASLQVVQDSAETKEGWYFPVSEEGTPVVFTNLPAGQYTLVALLGAYKVESIDDGLVKSVPVTLTNSMALSMDVP